MNSAPTSAFSVLPQHSRLKKRQEFKAVANGGRVHTELFTLQIVQRKAPSSAEDAALQVPRFGLTVTKKAGSSVERNRMRRRLRHALCDCMHAARTDYDYVIVARRPLLEASFPTLVQDLRQALKRGKPRRKPARGDGQEKIAGPVPVHESAASHISVSG